MKTHTKSGQAWRGYDCAPIGLLHKKIILCCHSKVQIFLREIYVAKYTPGQKVKHVTGAGPLMVVDHYNGSTPMVNCTWFIGSKLNKGVFHEDTLELFVRKVKDDKEED